MGKRKIKAYLPISCCDYCYVMPMIAQYDWWLFKIPEMCNTSHRAGLMFSWHQITELFLGQFIYYPKGHQVLMTTHLQYSCATNASFFHFIFSDHYRLLPFKMNVSSFCCTIERRRERKRWPLVSKIGLWAFSAL